MFCCEVPVFPPSLRREMTDDEALIQQLRDGDPYALEVIYKLYSRRLYAVARRIMRDSQAAEEVLQDAFFQLWQKASEFDPLRGSLIGWLLTMTRHRAISRIRSSESRSESNGSYHLVPFVQSGVIQQTALEHQIARELISMALSELPQPQREAVELAYFDGFTCDEIAERVNAPVGTVKTRLRSAMQFFRKKLPEPTAVESAQPKNRTVQLCDILITSELSTRACRKRDPLDETRAIRKLASVASSNPHEIIDALLAAGVELCRAGTAGVSLLETAPGGEQVFRWTHLAGLLAEHTGQTTPRNFSPCGVTLDCDSPQLFTYPARYFQYFNRITTPLVEGLVIPFHIENKTEGTIWICSHDVDTRFDSEDARIMTVLAEFTGCILHLLRTVTASDPTDLPN